MAGLEDVNSGTIILQDKDITNLEPSKRGFGISISIICIISEYDCL
ncbi:TPA: hypothetical protein ACSRFV_000118 [Clostridioides difficile]